MLEAALAHNSDETDIQFEQKFLRGIISSGDTCKKRSSHLTISSLQPISSLWPKPISSLWLKPIPRLKTLTCLLLLLILNGDSRTNNCGLILGAEYLKGLRNQSKKLVVKPPSNLWYTDTELDRESQPNCIVLFDTWKLEFHSFHSIQCRLSWLKPVRCTEKAFEHREVLESFNNLIHSLNTFVTLDWWSL